MNDLRKAYRTTAITGLVLMGSLLIYTSLVEMVAQGTIPVNGGTMMGADHLNTLKYVLLIIAALFFFLIDIVQKAILTSARSSSDTHRKTADPQAGLDFAIRRLATAAVVVFALCETPAIFGLVLFFLGKNSTDYYLFMFISLFFFSVKFPKYSLWEGWVRKQTRATRAK